MTGRRGVVAVAGMLALAGCSAGGGEESVNEGVEVREQVLAAVPSTSEFTATDYPSTTLPPLLPNATTTTLIDPRQFEYSWGGVPIHLWWGELEFSVDSLLPCSLVDAACRARVLPLPGVVLPPGGELTVAPGDVVSLVNLSLMERSSGEVLVSLEGADGNPTVPALTDPGDYLLAIDLSGPSRTVHYGLRIVVDIQAANSPPMTLPMESP